MHSTRSRAEHVSLWERAVSALRVSGPGLSASVGVPAGGRWLSVVWAQARAERLAAKRRAGTAPRWEFSFSWLVLGAFLRGELSCRKMRPVYFLPGRSFPGSRMRLPE